MSQLFLKYICFACFKKDLFHFYTYIAFRLRVLWTPVLMPGLDVDSLANARRYTATGRRHCKGLLQLRASLAGSAGRLRPPEGDLHRWRVVEVDGSTWSEEV